MGLVSRLFGRRLPIKYAITAKNNPYKARIHWPPDFRRLSFKEQFRFEKKYRRRSKMKHMNEKWVKSVKIFQWVTCSSLFVWLILFYDWPGEDDDSGEPAFWTVRPSANSSIILLTYFDSYAPSYSGSTLRYGRPLPRAGSLHRSTNSLEKSQPSQRPLTLERWATHDKVQLLKHTRISKEEHDTTLNILQD